ncbi:MAG: hypothetical protein U0359_23935 [Byssovorax sp.]
MTVLDTAARTRPLLLRAGARFTCFADGVCCTDMHRLGPLSSADVASLHALGRSASLIERVPGEIELGCAPSGACALLDEARCSLHMAEGPLAKPSICRRFPYSIVATPLGGRVATAHRCPCRTLGDRAPLDAVAVEEALAGLPGAVRAVPGRVRLAERTSLSLAQWASLEAPLIDRLAGGEPAHAVLRVDPSLPSIDGPSWSRTAEVFRAYGAGAQRGFAAMAWFGDGIAALLGEPVSPRERPWAEGFDRAERRAEATRSPAEILGDFIADLIWDLSWVDQGSFERARVTLGALAAIASAVAARLAALGLRPDRAMAEAVLVTELSAAHRLWAETARRIDRG